MGWKVYFETTFWERSYNGVEEVIWSKHWMISLDEVGERGDEGIYFSWDGNISLDDMEGICCS